MSYIQDFKKQLQERNLTKFLELWEEYCSNDEVDAEELLELLQMIKTSDLAPSFGKHIETTLPLWQTIEDQELNYKVFKLIIDIQTTNSPLLAEAAIAVIEAAYPDDPLQNERLRTVGLRSKDHFQGALSHYDMLAHLAKGNFVYHIGGWGVGEIMDMSPVREQIGVEFENMNGLKYFTFATACNTLQPLPKDHFLAKRFGNPDALEVEAKNDPVAVIKQLLKDLGPRTASEIKDDMCILVIPEEDWTRWWQATRTKLKKDPYIENPSGIKDPFILRRQPITHEETLRQTLKGHSDISSIIQSSYKLLRDTPNSPKNEKIFNSMEARLVGILENQEASEVEKLQAALLLEQFCQHKTDLVSMKTIIKEAKNPIGLIHAIDILSLKKRVVMLIQAFREDWMEIHLQLLQEPSLNPMRDYLFDTLRSRPETLPGLNATLEKIRKNPLHAPDFVNWYMQKLMDASPTEDLPYNNQEGRWDWFTSFLVLLPKIEHNPHFKALTKKMGLFVTKKHYEVLRRLLEGTSKRWAEECLLLLSKCMVFDNNDRNIFSSLVRVVHPTLGSGETQKRPLTQDSSVFWTTEQAYLKHRKQLERIATIEIVQNAKEVEAARAHGDLRENAEYKAACERRRSLQNEMRTLGQLIDTARILNPSDVNTNETGVGLVVTLSSPGGNVQHYTILGSWDADPDARILSHQSRLAQAMMGIKPGESFTFQGEEYKVEKLESFFDQ